MGDRWIVTSHPYMQHESLHAARIERARLTKVHGKRFRVLRVKTQLGASRAKKIIADLTREVEELRSKVAALQPDS